MAVNISKSGGIYIEISGDYTQLKKDLDAVRGLAKASASDISKSFGFPVDNKPIQDLAQSMIKAQAAAKTMRADFANQGGELRKWGQAIGLSGRELERYISLQDRAFKNQSIRTFGNELRNIQYLTGASNSEIRALAKSLGGTGNEFVRASKNAKGLCFDFMQVRIEAAKAALAFKAMSFPGDIARTAMQFDTLQRSFNAIAGSAAGGAEEMTFVRTEADRLGQDIFALADSYRGLSAAAKSSGMSQEQVRDIFSSVGEASTTLGLSSDQTKYALYALQQMMSKGVVSMEELRRQLGDQLPGAFAAAARAMGVTEVELIKMVESGQLMSRDFLPKFATEIRKTFGSGFEEASQSAARNMARLGNAFKEMANEIGGSGFLKGLSDSAKSISESLKTDEMQASLRQLGETLGSVTGLLGQGAAAAIKNHEALIALVAGYAALRLSNSALIPTFNAVTAAIKTQQLVIATARTKMQGFAAVGGNVFNALGGWGAVAAAAAGGIAYLAMRESEASKITKEYSATIEGLTGSSTDAATAIATMAREINAMSLTKANSALIDVQTDIVTSIQSMNEAVHKATVGGPLYNFAKMGMPSPLHNLASELTNDTVTVEKALDRVHEAFQKGYIDKEERESLEKEIGKLGALANSRTLLQEHIAGGGIPASNAVGETGAGSPLSSGLSNTPRSSGLSLDTVYKSAEEAAQRAADSLKNLQLRHSELTAELSGDNFATAMAKVASDYKTQLQDIEAKRQEVANKFVEWGKNGTLSGEVKIQLDEQDSSLLQEQELLARVRDVNLEIAKRGELMRQSGLNRDYADLLGNTRAMYEAEADLLEIEQRRLQIAEEKAIADKFLEENSKRREEYELALSGILKEQLLIQERLRIAESRANLDFGGMFETGINQMAKDAEQRVIDFWENTLPQSIGSATDTIGVAFAEIGMGTKSVSDAFSDMGKSIQGIFQQIISDFISMSIRMAMFGNDGTGGLFGGLISGIGGLFTGGGSGVTSYPLTSAKGNVFSAPALSAYSNSIVTKPTFFPFAHGVGLMGEAGAEAIMPLTRTRAGDLGVRFEGGNAGGDQDIQPVFNIQIINEAGGQATATATSRSSNGTVDIMVMLKKEIAGDIASGGVVGQSITNRFGAKPLVRGR